MTPASPVSGGDIVSLLRPFVAAPSVLPGGAVAVGEVLPGLAAAIAVDLGRQVNFLPAASVAALGGQDAVWATAMANLRQLPPMSAASVESAEGHSDSIVYELRSDDPFGASRICHPDGLLAAAGVRPNRFGLLVAVPSWYVVLLHVITGRGVLSALNLMGQAASQEHGSASGPQGVSPDVFFLTGNGQVQTVVHGDGMDGLVVNTGGLLGEVLFGAGGPLADRG